MRIERSPPIMHDPLANTGGEILSRVGAKRVCHCNQEDRDYREFQDG